MSMASSTRGRLCGPGVCGSVTCPRPHEPQRDTDRFYDFAHGVKVDHSGPQFLREGHGGSLSRRIRREA